MSGPFLPSLPRDAVVLDLSFFNRFVDGTAIDAGAVDFDKGRLKP